MWHDNETDIDLIDFQHLVTGVEAIIKNDQLLPCTIGIFGDWGSGKSSLLRMVESDLKKDKNILCIRFNGWLFDGYDDAKSVLMDTIVEEIISHRKLGPKAKKLIGKLLKQINWMKAARSSLKHGLAFATMGSAGLAISGIEDAMEKVVNVDYSKFLKDQDPKTEISEDDSIPTTIMEFHNDFSRLLKETKIQKLVVFIDDLDRCTPDTVIDTLEAIKLFLFVDKSAFLICSDERLIRYAVRRRFPEIPGQDMEVGRDYLEKLIQFPVRIPQLSVSEMESYVSLLFTRLYLETGKFETVRQEVMKNKGASVFSSAYSIANAKEIVGPLPPNLEEALILSALVIPVLATGLNGNPRQCKRFLNMLLMRIEMAKSKGISLNSRTLAKLMLLEYFKEESFKKLFELVSRSEGPCKDLELLEKRVARGKTDGDNHSNNAQEDSSSIALDVDLAIWLQDPWLNNWLLSEPHFATLDLREYLYFSRDKIGIVAALGLRLSPKAQELLNQLLGESAAYKKIAIDQTTDLSPADASAIFEALTSRLRSVGATDGGDAVSSVLFEFCAKRSELLSQLIPFLQSLPEVSILPSVIPRLQDVTRETTFASAAQALISKWGKSKTNPTLASVAKKRVQKD